MLVSAAAIGLVAGASLVREFDRALAGKVKALGSLMEQDAHGTELDFKDEVMPEYGRPEDPEYFQVWLDDGRILARSDSLGDRDLPRRAGSDAAPSAWRLRLPDGRPGRAVGIRVPIPLREEDGDEDGPAAPVPRRGPATADIVVARASADLDRAIAALAFGVLLAAAVTGVAVLAIVAVTVRRGLAPVVRLGDRVAAIDARSLSARLPTEDQAREVRPLSEKLNELLARLDEAFQRERRLTASMAHELRTPIAEIRSAAEVARRWPEDAALHREAVDTAFDVAVQMGRIVDALLRLARAEAGRELIRPERFDVAGVIGAVWGEYEERARDSGLAVDGPPAAGYTACTDRGLLELVVRNLVDNAVSHTPAGGSIRSRLENGGDRVVWTLENAPVSLAAGDLERFEEPLWTKEASRSTRRHVGLGLALARAIASLLGVTLAFELDGGALRARLAVPAA